MTRAAAVLTALKLLLLLSILTLLCWYCYATGMIHGEQQAGCGDRWARGR